MEARLMKVYDEKGLNDKSVESMIDLFQNRLVIVESIQMHIDSTAEGNCVKEMSLEWLNKMKNKWKDLKRKEELIMTDIGMVVMEKGEKSVVMDMEAQHRKEVLAGACNNIMENPTFKENESRDDIIGFQSQKNNVSEMLTDDPTTDIMSSSQSRKLTSANNENSTQPAKLSDTNDDEGKDGKNDGDGNDGRSDNGFEMQSSERLYYEKSNQDDQLVCNYIPEFKRSSSTDVFTNNLKKRSVATAEITEIADD